jgi:serine/threonine-protein kinase
MIAPPPREAVRDVPPPVVEEEEYAEAGGPERPLWPWLAAAAFVIAAAIAGFFVWHELSGSKVMVPVQLYQGEKQGQAERQIQAAHLVPDVKHGPSEKYRKGFVYDQNPDAGSRVERGGTVTIFVSTGPPKVTVPDVKGQQWPDAQQALTDQGLVPVEHIVPGKDKGVVAATDPPAGKSVPKGSKVRVNVMSGPQKIAVPGVVGQTLAQATAALHDDGFNVNPTYVDSTAPQNQVIHQNPAPGSSVPKGSTVNLQVSNGPPQVSVPSVVGESAQQAVTDLESAGFTVSQTYQTVNDASLDNQVLSQNPDGGSQAARHSTVAITIGQFSPGPPTTSTTTTTSD